MADSDLGLVDENGYQPEVLIISDSSGETAADVIRAATSQFEGDPIKMSRLSQVRSAEQVREYLDGIPDELLPGAVFHTIVDLDMRSEIRAELDRRSIPSIDLLGPAMNVIATLTGLEPVSIAGRRNEDDQRFHSRVAGMNFLDAHGENANPEGILEADAVLFGVTHSSKTPLALYLAFLGYKIATVVYREGGSVPEQLYQADPRRVFGMERINRTASTAPEGQMTNADAESYMGADAAADNRTEEQKAAHEIMDKIGCTVISIDGRSIEEYAAIVLNQLRTIEG
jgi:regulator of PEP synthase PpsR (kinase-PPPase family)